MPPQTLKNRKAFPKLPVLIAIKLGMVTAAPAAPSSPVVGNLPTFNPAAQRAAEKAQREKDEKEAAEWFDHVLLDRVMLKFKVPPEVQGLIFQHLIDKPGVHYLKVKNRGNPAVPILSAQTSGSDRSLYRTWWVQCNIWPTMQDFYKSTFIKPIIAYKNKVRTREMIKNPGLHIADSSHTVIDGATDIVVFDTDVFISQNGYKASENLLRGMFLGENLERIGFSWNHYANIDFGGTYDAPVFPCFCPRENGVWPHTPLCPRRMAKIVHELMPNVKTVYLFVKVQNCQLRGWVTTDRFIAQAIGELVCFVLFCVMGG